MYTESQIPALRRTSSFGRLCAGAFLLACMMVLGCAGDPADTALLPGQQTNPDRSPPAAAIRVSVLNESAYPAGVQVHLYIGNALVHHCEALLEPAAGSDLADRLLLDLEEADRVVITCRIEGVGGAALWSDQQTYRMGTDFADLDTVSYSIVYPPVGNRIPVADAGYVPPAVVGNTVTLDGAASSDPDNDSLTYRWSQLNSPPDPAVTLLPGPYPWTVTFVAPDTITAGRMLTFQLIVNDGQADSTPATVAVEVSPANDPPTVSVSWPSIVRVNDVVQLDGSLTSDPENDPLTYQWEQLNAVPGTDVTLLNAGQPIASFLVADTMPDAQSLTFRLTVSDGHNAPVTQIVDVLVGPVAIAAAPTTAPADSSVSLDGTASLGAATLTYQWTHISGPYVFLANDDQAIATFTSPSTGGLMTFELTVSDGVRSHAATVSVEGLPLGGMNTPPVADVGYVPPAVVGEIVVLDGSGSYDFDEDLLTYHWTQQNSPPDPAVTLEPTVNPWEIRFTVPASIVAPQTLTFQLIVNDGEADSPPATITVDVSPALLASKPVAIPPVVLGGDSVVLDGSASTGPITSWHWTQLSGQGVAFVPNADQQQISFTAPMVSSIPETLVFELTVSDGTNTHSANVSVTVLGMGMGTGYPVPVGPSSAVVGDAVTLYGSASFDITGAPLTYQWMQTFGPSVTLSATNQPDVTFTVPPTVVAPDTLHFQLTVFDATMMPASTSFVMGVYPSGYSGNRCPVLTVSASPPTAAPGQMVTITATATDPDSDPVNVTLAPMFNNLPGASGPSPLVHTFQVPSGSVWPDNVLRFLAEADDGRGEGTAASVLVRVGRLGDVNGDGSVNSLDLAIVDAAMGSGPGDANWDPRADLNGNGVVTSMDRTIVLNNMDV